MSKFKTIKMALCMTVHSSCCHLKLCFHVECNFLKLWFFVNWKLVHGCRLLCVFVPTWLSSSCVYFQRTTLTLHVSLEARYRKWKVRISPHSKTILGSVYVFCMYVYVLMWTQKDVIIYALSTCRHHQHHHYCCWCKKWYINMYPESLELCFYWYCTGCP